MTYSDIRIEGDDLIIKYDYGDHFATHRTNLYRVKNKVYRKLPESVRNQIDDIYRNNPNKLIEIIRRPRQKGMISHEEYTLQNDELTYTYIYLKDDGRICQKKRTVNINTISPSLMKRLPKNIVRDIIDNRSSEKEEVQS